MLVSSHLGHRAYFACELPLAVLCKCDKRLSCFFLTWEQLRTTMQSALTSHDLLAVTVVVTAIVTALYEWSSRSSPRLSLYCARRDEGELVTGSF